MVALYLAPGTLRWRQRDVRLICGRACWIKSVLCSFGSAFPRQLLATLALLGLALFNMCIRRLRLQNRKAGWCQSLHSSTRQAERLADLQLAVFFTQRDSITGSRCACQAARNTGVRWYKSHLPELRAKSKHLWLSTISSGLRARPQSSRASQDTGEPACCPPEPSQRLSVQR